MITCSKCAKENQDHYKFCLGCGAELPRESAPKPFAPRTPPQGMKVVQAGKTGAPPAVHRSPLSSAPAPVATQPPAAPPSAAAPSPFSLPQSASVPQPPPTPMQVSMQTPMQAPTPMPAPAQVSAPAQTSGPAQVSAPMHAPAPMSPLAPTPGPPPGPPLAPVSLSPASPPSPGPPPGQVSPAAGSPFATPRSVARPQMPANVPLAPSSPAALAPVATPAPKQPAAVPRPGGEPSTEAITCPQCSHVNSTAFKFCASCGFNLSKVAAVSKAPAAPVARPADVVVKWKLTVLRADGTDEGTYEVPDKSTVVGRDSGGVFGRDLYLSPQHATLSVRGGKLFVQDSGSLNGTYIKLKRDISEPLVDGQLFRIGQEIVRFEKLHPDPPSAGVEKMGSPSAGYVGRIVLVTGRRTDGSAYPVPQLGIHIGRERGHVMFPEDGYVSGLHCSLLVKDGEVFLTDLGSSNGTFIRLNSAREVMTGDILLMGQQLFRASH